MDRVHERLKVKHLAVAPPKPKMGPGR
jgi:hypothetical protein